MKISNISDFHNLTSYNDTTKHECIYHDAYISPWTTFASLGLLYILALTWYYKNRKSMCLPVPETIFPYTKRLKKLQNILEPYLVDDVFIELTDHKLGQGSIGFVFKGFVYPKTQTRFKQKKYAAIKLSYPIPQQSIGLLEEAARLSRLNHPNIVKLIAISRLSFSAFRPMFAMEWLSGGSLSEYFKNLRTEKVDEDKFMSRKVYVRQIINVLSQVGEALKYIHESRDQDGSEFTHGDVAARNVLLTHRDLENCIAKLGDFGLPIDFGPRLPIPYLPPEIVCAADYLQCVHRVEADVYMFGVLGWECATLGAEPHYQKSFEEIQKSLNLRDRGLQRPKHCPDDYWEFLLNCLDDQHRRPRFSGKNTANILTTLEKLSKHYINSTEYFTIVQNMSNCSCRQHRCGMPLPSFTQ
uniref:Protein kinase domain-containing protein n=1 Tax=Parastrongyloides trichosuri TaxID=131310 RepID=A0A0N4Z2E8_PARTI